MVIKRKSAAICKVCLSTKACTVVLALLILFPLLAVFSDQKASLADPVTPNSVLSLQAQAAQLYQQIVQQNNAINSLSEQFDQAQIKVNIDQQLVNQDSAKITTVSNQLAIDKSNLRSAAINAYLLYSPLDNLSSIVGSDITSNQMRQAYSLEANKTLNNAINATLNSQNLLLEDLKSKSINLNQAKIEQAQLTSDKESAIAAQNQAQATLSQVKGSLAQALAQEAQQQAQQAAAILNQEASQKAAQAAQAQAAHALSVAQVLSATNPSSSTVQSAVTNIVTSVASDPSKSTTGTQSTSTSTSTSDTTVTYPPPPVSDRLVEATAKQGQEAVAEAETFLGVPYVWGGQSSSGVDCSGLVLEAWDATGISLLHSAYYQYTESTPVSLNSLQPGDLLFYNFSLDGNPNEIDHVVMYVGSGPYGSQTIIQASQPGTNVSYAPMYMIGFISAGRP